MGSKFIKVYWNPLVASDVIKPGRPGQYVQVEVCRPHSNDRVDAWASGVLPSSGPALQRRTDESVSSAGGVCVPLEQVPPHLRQALYYLKGFMVPYRSLGGQNRTCLAVRR